MLSLQGKKGLIVGIANNKSIAWGAAKVMSEAGASLAITYLNDHAKPYVEPLAKQVNAEILLPLNVESSQEMDSVFEKINDKWGKLDFILHSIAFASKHDLEGRVVDSSKDGFLKAMDISCHSFIRMANLAEPLMKTGGSLLTVTYMGSHEVVEHYSIMGPVKAALESSVKYLAAELGSKSIRVNAISPGPIMTRAASGISHFDELLAIAKQKAPLKREVTLKDIGYLAAFLVSDLSLSITGNIHYVDSGYSSMD